MLPKWNKQTMSASLLTAWLLIFGTTTVIAEQDPVLAKTRLIVSKHRDLQQLQSQVKAAAQKAKAATVSVRVGRGRSGFAFGSGVIVSEDGYVLTAAHVSSRPDQAVEFHFEDGTTANGITLGLHQDLDMGLMKITDPGPWPFLTRAKSANLKTGDWVLATGHPGGFDRDNPPVVRLGRILKKTEKVLLTDCTLVGGDSGGPLVNLQGNVIGVHSRIGADLTTNLHVPIDRFAENWKRLVQKEVWGLLKMSRPFIGIEHDRDSKRARISKVRPGGPASNANLEVGDIIVRFDGEEVSNFRSLRRMVSNQDAKSLVKVEYERNGSYYETKLRIGAKEFFGESQTRDDADLLREWLESISIRRGRGRAIVGIGKNSDQVKRSFKRVLDAASRSTVKVLDNANVVALGTIIDDRLIITKASALKSGNLHCRYRLSGAFPVEKVAELRSHDLALLKAGRKLPAIKFDVAKTPDVGAILASSDLNTEPIAIGVASTPAMRIPSEGKLGITMGEDGTAPPYVTNLIVGSGADLAGIKIGDLVKSVDNVSVSSADDLVNMIQGYFPGDRILLTVKRDEQLLEVPAKLARFSDLDDALAEFEDFIGGELSKRRTGFARVVQHDTPIRPIHCGGPVVDVNGRFVGINIARSARTSSLLLPAQEVKYAIDKLRASRKDTVKVQRTVNN